MLRTRKEWRLARGGIAATVAVMLTLVGAGCAETARVVGPTPTATLPPLVWQPVGVPPGYNSLGSVHGPLAFAPSDGRTAYTCGVAGAGNQDRSPGVWVTHDRGATWTRTADIPVSQAVRWCWVVPDSIDPAIAVAMVSWAPNGVGPVPNLSQDFATFDRGMTWRLLTGDPQPFLVNAIATHQGTTLAVLNGGVGGGDIRLWASRDQMRTRQPIAPPAGVTSWGNPAIWLDPGSGAILVQTGTDAPQLWSSADGGQRWTQLPAPALDPASILVAPPVVGGPWHICGITAHPADPINGGAIACSADGGQRWTQRPRPVVTSSGPGGSSKQDASPFAVTGDGTLLFRTDQIYRLASSASVWQSLGPVPADDLATAEMPGAGILWEWQTNTGPAVAGPYPVGDA